MTAVALPAPRAFVSGVLRLQVELRWGSSVVISRSFEHGVWAGPTKYHPFPIEGFGCEQGFVLAAREGDVFTVNPPPGLRGAKAVRLGEGMRGGFSDGQLTLRAWVTREPQAVSLAWLWLYFGALALMSGWVILDTFGVLLAFLLYLLPHPAPSALLLSKTAAQPLRPVKVRPFVPEVKPPPLPEKTQDRLAMLMAGKRSNDIFKDAGKKAAARDEGRERKKALQRAAAFGMIDLINAKPGHEYAILGALSGGNLNRLEGGVVGGVVGGEASAFGGLGLKGLGPGGGGIGLGSIGTGSGLGHLGRGSDDPARTRARELARPLGQKCFANKEGRAVIRVEYDAAGRVAAVKLQSPSGLLPVDDCLINTISGWRLPATPSGGIVHLVFHGEL